MSTPKETTTGGGPREFPTTSWSALLDARDPRSPRYAQAFNRLVLLYWKPVYAYLRMIRSFDHEEAKDLTQDFVLGLIEGPLLRHYSPERGNFRNYVKGAIRIFLLKRNQKAMTKKRGGGRTILTLDDSEIKRIETVAVHQSQTPEEALERQWAFSVIEHAVGELRDELMAEGKEIYFRVFDRYDLNPPEGDCMSYSDLAKELGLKESAVTNYLRHCRQMLRKILKRRVEDYVADESEIAGELERLLS